MSILKLSPILFVVLILFAGTKARAYMRPLQATPQTSLILQHAYQSNLSDITPLSNNLTSYRASKPLKRKSYLIGVCGAALSPMIGHSYIGGWNILRGLFYFSTEVFMFGLVLHESFDPNSGTSGEHYLYTSWAIHAINIFDAAFTIRHINKKVSEQKTSVTIITGINTNSLRFAVLF